MDWTNNKQEKPKELIIKEVREVQGHVWKEEQLCKSPEAGQH